MNKISFGFLLHRVEYVFSKSHQEGSLFCKQWPWRVPVERRVSELWNTIRHTPVVSFRETPRGNTIVENHPDLPFPSTVLYSGRTVLRNGIVPPVTMSMRITRTGGW